MFPRAFYPPPPSDGAIRHPIQPPSRGIKKDHSIWIFSTRCVYWLARWSIDYIYGREINRSTWFDWATPRNGRPFNGWLAHFLIQRENSLLRSKKSDFVGHWVMQMRSDDWQFFHLLGQWNLHKCSTFNLNFSFFFLKGKRWKAERHRCCVNKWAIKCRQSAPLSGLYFGRQVPINKRKKPVVWGQGKVKYAAPLPPFYWFPIDGICVCVQGPRQRQVERDLR